MNALKNILLLLLSATVIGAAAQKRVIVKPQINYSSQDVPFVLEMVIPKEGEVSYLYNCTLFYYTYNV